MLCGRSRGANGSERANASRQGFEGVLWTSSTVPLGITWNFSRVGSRRPHLRLPDAIRLSRTASAAGRERGAGALVVDPPGRALVAVWGLASGATAGAASAADGSGAGESTGAVGSASAAAS